MSNMTNPPFNTGDNTPDLRAVRVVWRPGVASNGKYAKTWAEIYSIIQQNDGFVTVVVDDSLAACNVPAGVYDCKGRVAFEGAKSRFADPVGDVGSPVNKMVMQSGAQFVNPRSFQFVEVKGIPTGISWISLTTVGAVLDLLEGAMLRKSAGSSVIAAIRVSAIASVNLSAAAIVPTGGAAEMILVDPTITDFFLSIEDSKVATLDPNLVKSTGTGSVALHITIDGSIAVPAQQAHWGGSVQNVSFRSKTASLLPLAGATGARPVIGAGMTPAYPYVGMQYFDTTLGAPLWWNGAAWVLATGLAPV